MSASILDPRMIDPSKPLTITSTILTNVTASDIVTSSGTSNDWNATNTLVQNNSTNWTDTYTTVQTFSASWEESEDITNLSVQITGLSSDFIGFNTYIQSNSAIWQSTYETVSTLSASWEESADILPTVTNYLSTELITVSSLNATEQLLSANNDLFSLFLTPANTLTTSICAISGDGATPFIMQFTNGLLTSITF
jgi:hypothetical protein